MPPESSLNASGSAALTPFDMPLGPSLQWLDEGDALTASSGESVLDMQRARRHHAPHDESFTIEGAERRANVFSRVS